MARKADTPGDLFVFERALSKQGISLIAGIDEAGRGPLAGPVVAAAVVLPIEWFERGLPSALRGLNDSKQLTCAQRNRFFEALCSLHGIQFGISSVDSSEVDNINILQATHRAMRAALAKICPSPQHVLVDGRFVKTIEFCQTPVIKGDSRSYTIAAASVMAKVTRDRIMEDYHERWPAYGFATHKGYGTQAHLEALARHGPCPIHRRSFAPVKQTVFI